jgi:hypothetical protein
MKLDTPEQIKSFLEANPKTSIIGEGGKLYSLIDGEVKVIEPNYYHTWEYIQEVRKELVGTAVEETWADLSSQYGVLVEGRENYKTGGSPLATLASLWEFTCYPPPEVMASIAETYNHYMRLGGAATLEEVFFGKPKKVLGTHSRQESSKGMLQHLEFLIQCDKVNSRSTPQIERAIETIEFYKSSKDPETLLRAYRRSKIK